MGVNMSKKLIPFRGGEEETEEEKQEKIARRIFKRRMEDYNYAYHGPQQEYIKWCLARYEYDCIPVHCRRGTNYIDD